MYKNTNTYVLVQNVTIYNNMDQPKKSDYVHLISIDYLVLNENKLVVIIRFFLFLFFLHFNQRKTNDLLKSISFNLFTNINKY